MSPHIISSQVGIVATKTLTLIIGGLITYYSYRAYDRTGAPELRALAAGFGIVTAGAVFGGALHLIVSNFLDIDIVLSLFAESVFTTVGFAVILYSLYVR